MHSLFDCRHSAIDKESPDSSSGTLPSSHLNSEISLLDESLLKLSENNLPLRTNLLQERGEENDGDDDGDDHEERFTQIPQSTKQLLVLVDEDRSYSVPSRHSGIAEPNQEKGLLDPNLHLKGNTSVNPFEQRSVNKRGDVVDREKGVEIHLSAVNESIKSIRLEIIKMQFYNFTLHLFS